MINETLPNSWPKEQIGLPIELIMSLNDEARALYDQIYDYCTYAADPQYQRLHKYRNQISKLQGRDRDILIEFFNNDPAIRWNAIPCEPFEYYKEPY